MDIIEIDKNGKTINGDDFFVVISDIDGRKKHFNLDEARQEAKRLVLKEGRIFYILQTLEKASVIANPVKIETLRINIQKDYR